MSFWKLVAAIVVGNILTGIVAAVAWLLLLGSMLSTYNTESAEIKEPAVPTYQEPDGKSAAWRRCINQASNAEEAIKCREVD